MLGKRLYKTRMLNIFCLAIFAMVVIFINNFILETYTYEKFQADGRFKIVDVIQYHYRYPLEFVSFFFLVLAPAFYYTLIRGIRFHEKGFVFNRGIPFMNKVVPYSEVKTYKLLHPKHIVSIHTVKGDVFLVADNNVDRVIAILDQQNIQGDFGRDDYINLITNFKKFALVIIVFTFVVFLLKKMGVFAQ
jgi:hypothetical protein